MIQQIDITKIADEIKKENSFEMYWDYQDTLSEEQIIKLLTIEDYLYEIENELMDYNSSYIYEEVDKAINEYLERTEIELAEEEHDELRCELEGSYDFNINGLIRNSSINLRVTLMSNEDMICIDDWKNSNTVKAFKKAFRGKYNKEELERERLNLASSYGLFTFYFNVRGDDILILRKQILEGKIELKEGLSFGLFNSYEGSGSLLDMKLLKPITLNLRDWRFKTLGEEVVNALDEGSKYYYVSIQADALSKYGIDETYGIGRFQQW